MAQKDGSKDVDLLERIIDKLKRGSRQVETFSLTVRAGRIKVSWVSMDEEERRTVNERVLNLGDHVGMAQIRQHIESTL